MALLTMFSFAGISLLRPMVLTFGTRVRHAVFLTTSLRYTRAALRPSLGNSCMVYVVRCLTVMALTLHGSRSFLARGEDVHRSPNDDPGLTPGGRI